MSKLPTMIKKPTIRSNIPTDRLNGTASGLPKPSQSLGGGKVLPSSRNVLTQNFENICNQLRNGTGSSNRPLKRHASPEFRAGSMAHKKLRRSRSVSDMEVLLKSQSHRSRADLFALPTAPAPRALKTATATATAATTASNAQATARPKATATSAIRKPLASVKKVEPTKPRGGAVAKAMNTATKSTAGATAKSTSNTAQSAPKARIAPYDFKARFLDLQEKHKLLKEKHDELKNQFADYESLPDKYEECQQNLTTLESEYQEVKEQLKSLKKESVSDALQIKTLSDDLDAKIEECRALIETKTQLSDELKVVKGENTDLKVTKARLETEMHDYRSTTTHTIEHLTMELELAKEQLYRANLDRKELHNTIMDLRGNIRVFCRVRPPLSNETDRNMCTYNYADETALEIAGLDNSKKQVRHEFNFDQVFAPNSRQQDIFEMVSPMIQSALDGYNICIFAYGQTGSGKTFTMDGTENSTGIIPRTTDLLFDSFEQYKRLGWSYKLHVSALEIYNETLYDLLSNDVKDLDIRMVSAKTPNEIFVSNLTEALVENRDQLCQLLELAKVNRATAATAGNERSSRSHAVVQLKVVGEHKGKGEVCGGTINLIDLAGSESPKTSTRMDETKKINRSLSELTNVIMALVRQQDHIPYRNSKLTHLLMPSLGGNSKTLMFVNVAPFMDCFGESVKSLRFAASVNQCKLAKAKKNKHYTSPE